MKVEYQGWQSKLTEVKQVVTNSENVAGVIDQQSKSKLRINIETLLIDINEELFAISEELARIF